MKKYRTLGHVPIEEHRRLTGEILKQWLRNPELIRCYVPR